jgi:hypothetical protein
LQSPSSLLCSSFRFRPTTQTSPDQPGGAGPISDQTSVRCDGGVKAAENGEKINILSLRRAINLRPLDCGKPARTFLFRGRVPCTKP